MSAQSGTTERPRNAAERNAAERDAAERTATRRADWRAEVVTNHTTKGPLYQDLTPIERLRAFAQLNRRVWCWTESQMTQRSQWTSADFEVIPAGATCTTPAP